MIFQVVSQGRLFFCFDVFTLAVFCVTHYAFKLSILWFPLKWISYWQFDRNSSDFAQRSTNKDELIRFLSLSRWLWPHVRSILLNMKSQECFLGHFLDSFSPTHSCECHRQTDRQTDLYVKCILTAALEHTIARCKFGFPSFCNHPSELRTDLF